MSVTLLAEGVRFVEGPESNWTILTGDGTTTLIDCGYPADYDLVLQSIRDAGGQPDDVTILVTHGHADHIGTAARLVREHGARVLVHPDELKNVTREELHQVGVPEVLRRLHRPRVVRWALRAIAAGGLSPVAVSAAATYDPALTLVASGHSIQVVGTAGHTPGHAAYWLHESRVLVVGDALVSAHPTSRLAGVQLLDRMFHADLEAAIGALDELLAFDPLHILPGHGPAVAGFLWPESVAFAKGHAHDVPDTRTWRTQF